MIELLLVAPGLLGPWPEINRPGFPLPPARNLARILAGGRQHPADGDFHRVVTTLHGVESGAAAEPPIASLSRLADGGHSDKQRWLRFDLVHLVVDKGKPRLGHSGTLQISEAESESLWQRLAPYFNDIGWRVEPLHRSRWYLSLDAHDGLQKASLDAGLTRHATVSAPATPAAGQWLTRLTEIQMLLHDTPVNHERERRDRPTINALWPRGGDVLPDAVRAPVTKVYSTDVVLAGLATISREAYSAEVPMSFDSLLGSTREETGVLVALDGPGEALAGDDPFLWCAAVEELERLWLAPALAGLRSGRLRGLNLWPCNGRVYRIASLQAWFALLRSGSLCRHF